MRIGDKKVDSKPVINLNKGFTYVGLLLFIAITGIVLSVAGMCWQYQVRAEKEKQLLFVGAEFRNAIDSYYASTPDVSKVYPTSLNDLLLDKRLPTIKRHLRKIYPDPMTGKTDWRFVTQQGRIVGIYSQSKLTPFKKRGFDLADAGFSGSKSYHDWVFKFSDEEKSKIKLNPVVTSNSTKLQGSLEVTAKVESLNDSDGSPGIVILQPIAKSRASLTLAEEAFYLKNGVLPE